MRPRASTIALCVLLISGCVSRPAPPEASWTTQPPPWEPPRHAISWITAADLPEQSIGEDSDPWIFNLAVTVDGESVEVPAFIGVDRLRAIQAPVHTHESGGEVWLEGQGNREVTLGDFFRLWGVYFDDTCLAQFCDNLQVSADGVVIDKPTTLVLRGHTSITVSVRSV